MEECEQQFICLSACSFNFSNLSLGSLQYHGAHSCMAESYRYFIEMTQRMYPFYKFQRFKKFVLEECSEQFICLSACTFIFLKFPLGSRQYHGAHSCMAESNRYITVPPQKMFIFYKFEWLKKFEMEECEQQCSCLSACTINFSKFSLGFPQYRGAHSCRAEPKRYIYMPQRTSHFHKYHLFKKIDMDECEHHESYLSAGKMGFSKFSLILHQ